MNSMNVAGILKRSDEPMGRSRRRTGEAGFSLVEVILALGLLAGVMISIAGLFALANRDMNGGRNTTEAMAVGRDVLEEINGWAYSQTWSLFGFDGTATSYTADTRSNALAQKWQPALDESLYDSWAEIEIESIVPTGGAPNLAAARAIRVVVTVFWTEGQRDRSVTLSTVRI